jgi:hypothetical protein
MDFYAILDQVVALLRQRQRVTYRALKRHFQLDDAVLDDLTMESRMRAEAESQGGRRRGGLCRGGGSGDGPPAPRGRVASRTIRITVSFESRLSPMQPSFPLPPGEGEGEGLCGLRTALSWPSPLHERESHACNHLRLQAEPEAATLGN